MECLLDRQKLHLKPHFSDIRDKSHELCREISCSKISENNQEGADSSTTSPPHLPQQSQEVSKNPRVPIAQIANLCADQRFPEGSGAWTLWGALEKEIGRCS